MRRLGQTFLLLAFVTACGSVGTPSQALTAKPLVLVTLPPDATATPTPFQPVSANNTTVSSLPTDTPTGVAPIGTPTLTATPELFDPNSLLPGTWTPPDLYVPPSAPAQFPLLTDNETVTFLLLGSDVRNGSSFRTDTIVVTAIRPQSGQVSLISIPRDLWVYIPTVGMNRINTAYEYGDIDNYPGGGAALLKDTILYNLGIRIDHLTLIDFDGFKDIINTLGGINLPVACPYTDWHLIDPNADQQNANNWSLYTVGPGIVHMDGDLALWYARSREKSSDFDRGRRSQEVLRAIYARALQTNVIGKIPELYKEFSSTITTDLTLPDILELSPLALNLTNANIRSYYIGRDDVTGWTTSAGADVLLPNDIAIQALLQQALAPSAQLQRTTALTIEVRNGTSNPGWDALAAQRLNYAGYNTRLAPSDRSDYSGSLLYDLSPTPDSARDSSLLAILGLPQSALVLAPIQSDVPYVLIVGADYQTCFNPANMAH
jgi:LCP family protein required for cell wall assembly